MNKQNKLPTRKEIRLKTFDYNTPAYYFVTICTYERKSLFWENHPEDVGAVNGRPQDAPLNEKGQIVKQVIENIPKHYADYSVETYAIMPNHIHLLLELTADGSGRPMTAPTLSTVINQFKGAVTKQIGSKVWQKSFMEHIIRDQEDYINHYNYIENNPVRWVLGQDEYS